MLIEVAHPLSMRASIHHSGSSWYYERIRHHPSVHSAHSVLKPRAYVEVWQQQHHLDTVFFHRAMTVAFEVLREIPETALMMDPCYC
jgi:hypothetical protein